MTQTIAYTIVQ